MVCAPSLGGILDELKDMERVRLEKIDLRFNVYPQLKTIKDYLLFLPKLLYHFLINSISYYKLLFLAKKETGREVCLQKKKKAPLSENISNNDG